MQSYSMNPGVREPPKGNPLEYQTELNKTKNSLRKIISGILDGLSFSPIGLSVTVVPSVGYKMNKILV